VIERLLTAGSGRVARIRFTDRFDGDFRIDGHPDELAAARRAVADLPWTWLRQVHGARVIQVEEPGDGAGEEADASVTSHVGAVLAVQSADCAPVVLVNRGAVAIAHVGGRGLLAGVIPAATDALRTRGTGEIRAVLGPTIRPGHYEFGEVELATVVEAVGERARSSTLDGRPALDLSSAVASSLASAGVDHLDDPGLDTSGSEYFSHRCRRDVGRQATTVVLEAV
jgi:YfiH family protein